MDDRLIYKMLMRSCIFNDIKYDQKAFFCVALLDFCKFLPFARVFLFATRR
jgi:hypothetical protein